MNLNQKKKNLATSVAMMMMMIKREKDSSSSVAVNFRCLNIFMANQRGWNFLDIYINRRATRTKVSGDEFHWNYSAWKKTQQSPITIALAKPTCHWFGNSSHLNTSTTADICSRPKGKIFHFIWDTRKKERKNKRKLLWINNNKPENSIPFIDCPCEKKEDRS